MNPGERRVTELMDPFEVVYIPDAPYPPPPLKTRTPEDMLQPNPLPSRPIPIERFRADPQSAGSIMEGVEKYPLPPLTRTGEEQTPPTPTVNVPPALPELKLNCLLLPMFRLQTQPKFTDCTINPLLTTTDAMLLRSVIVDNS